VDEPGREKEQLIKSMFGGDDVIPRVVTERPAATIALPIPSVDHLSGQIDE
jgi:hypothetical protein